MPIDLDEIVRVEGVGPQKAKVQARRGWAEKQDIINAWPVEKLLSSLR
jgi:hypothetical protein